MNPKEELAFRVKEVAQHLLQAAEALDRDDWEELRTKALEVSREARVLSLMEKQKET